MKNATIKRAWTQWFVVVDGEPGGIAMASKKAAEEYCRKNGYAIKHEGLERT